jgi:DNA helicase II / ATP-dependent DNA helicase PcrA
MAAMRFHAGPHVHSKHSRATSRDLDLEPLAAWAARKGIAVIGTGDFCHPARRTALKVFRSKDWLRRLHKRRGA